MLEALSAINTSNKCALSSATFHVKVYRESAKYLSTEKNRKTESRQLQLQVAPASAKNHVINKDVTY